MMRLKKGFYLSKILAVLVSRFSFQIEWKLLITCPFSPSRTLECGHYLPLFSHMRNCGGVYGWCNTFYEAHGTDHLLKTQATHHP